MNKNLFQISELEAFIGSEHLCDFDLTAIIKEATFIDMEDPDKNRYWRGGINLGDICARHDMTVNDSDYVSATQAAKILGVSRMRVNQLVNNGQLEARKIGGMWAIDRASVESRKFDNPGPGRRW